MPSIKQLETLIKKNHIERQKLNDQLDELKKKKELPALKKKYENKYFKYENSYGTDVKWWLYSYCSEVSSINFAICECFQCEKYGEWKFKIREETGFFILQEEISEKEYYEASLNLISAANFIMQLK